MSKVNLFAYFLMLFFIQVFCIGFSSISIFVYLFDKDIINTVSISILTTLSSLILAFFFIFDMIFICKKHTLYKVVGLMNTILLFTSLLVFIIFISLINGNSIFNSESISAFINIQWTIFSITLTGTIFLFNSKKEVKNTAKDNKPKRKTNKE